MIHTVLSPFVKGHVVPYHRRLFLVRAHMKGRRTALVVVLLASQWAYGAQWSKPVESATPVPAWGATIVESERCVVESDDCEMTLYLQPNGSRRRLLASHVVGAVIALGPWRTIFSCEENSILGTSAPLLISLE